MYAVEVKSCYSVRPRDKTKPRPILGQDKTRTILRQDRQHITTQLKTKPHNTMHYQTKQDKTRYG
jgi:hypothetical protein